MEQKIKELEEMVLSFPPNLGLVKTEFLNKIEELKVEAQNSVPKWRSVSWSVEDFGHRAFQLQTDRPEKCFTFDETKYEDALEKMINKHDANIGITWDTIDFYLMECCLKSWDKGDYEL